MKLERLAIPSPMCLLALAVALPAALSLHESFDLMFSVASGHWIVDKGFPSADPFSYTADHPWFLQAWAYCVSVSLSVTLMGGYGPAVLMGLLLAGFIALLGKLLSRLDPKPGAMVLLMGILVLACQSYGLGAERSYHVGNLLFCLVALLITQAQDNYRKTILAVPVICLWANFHGSWVAGPAVLGAAGIGFWLEEKRLSTKAVFLTLVGIMGFVSAVLTPETWSTWLFPFRLVAGAKGHHIAEWHAWTIYTSAGQALAILTALAGATIIRANKRSWHLILPAAGMLVVAARMERFAVLAGVLLAANAILHHSQSRSRESSPAEWAGLVMLRSACQTIERWFQVWTARTSAAWLPWFGVALVAFWATLNPQSLASRLDPGLFPVEAIQKLCTLPPGRVLNTYRFGGAISALCGPGHKVFIDGREEPFPDQVHDDYRKLALLEEGWPRVISDYRPDYLLWSRKIYGQPLLGRLEQTDRWRLLVRTGPGELWVKSAVPALPEPQ